MITTLKVRREEPWRRMRLRARCAGRVGLVAIGLVEPSELEAEKFPNILKEFKRSMIVNSVIVNSLIGKSMMRRFARTAAIVLGLSLFALAQAGQSASTPAETAPPDAPSAAPAPGAPVKATGTKVGSINIEQAIFSSNEGQRDFQALSKKFEPKQSELKNSADEIDSLKKQLNAQQDKLNDEAREKLVKQIESKQKSFERAQQDAQEDFQGQQGEIGNKILTKMAPLIVKYAADNGYGMILDTSQQWPRGPVIWYGPAVDITAPVVEAYNAQSGVAPPPVGSTTATPAKKPAATGTKPAASKPAATTPPKQ
ncbi:MAG: OmpH family outer membrane protein [Terriglobales bacterium]